MIVSDWRTARPETVSRLYSAQTDRWLCDLDWDIASQWGTVETARANQELPGFIVQSPAGEILGWSFHLIHRQTLQVGAFVSSSLETTARLIEAILGSQEARQTTGLMMFGYFQAPGLRALLEPAGLGVERYRYLQRALDVAPKPETNFPTYDHGYSIAVSDLLAASYDAVDPLRPFAPTGQRDEWVEYLAQLTIAQGCGEFDPAMSPVSPCEFGGFEGAALVTRIAPTVAHLAQIVVHPLVRGRKVGRGLVLDAMSRAARQGCDRLTLLVSERNEKAGRMYERLGFEETASFVSVGRPQSRQAATDSRQPQIYAD